MLQDLRHAVRLLSNRPGLTIAAIATLALGVGANAAVLSLARAVALRPLPYADADRLVMLQLADTNGRVDSRAVFAIEEFQSLREYRHLWGDLAAVKSWRGNLQPRMDLIGSGTAERLRGALASPNFFELLGVQASLGRTFTAADGSNEGNPVVILSDGLWRRRFGADPNVVGSTIHLLAGRSKQGARPFTVLGVLPERFRFTYPEETELWVLETWPELARESRRAVQFDLIGRLRPGVTTGQAKQVLSTLQLRRSAVAVPIPISAHVAGEVRPLMLLMTDLAGLVLVIASVNIANLLLAGALLRAREIALRTAIGAGRARIVRQLVAENVLLIACGVVAGMMLAALTIPALRAIVPIALPRADETSIDLWVLGSMTLTFLAVGLTAGLVPAWIGSRLEPLAVLRRTDSGFGSRSAARWRQAVTAVQVTIAIVLFVAGSLLLRSLWHLQHVDLGFDGRDVLTMEMRLTGMKYREPGRHAQFARDLLERVRAIPGVTDASITSSVPMRGVDWMWRISLDDGRTGTSNGREVDHRYFDLMRIPLRAGRLFTERDDAASAPVAIVSESFAREMFGSVSPIGRRIIFDTPLEIVGVVADVRHRSVEAPGAPAIYVPRAQRPSELVCLVIRTAGEQRGVVDQVRRAVSAIDPAQPVERVTTLDRLVADTIADRRFYAVVSAVAAGLGLILTLVGIAGIVARAVTERRREIAIRLALGATVARMRRLLLSQALKPVAVGLAAGLLASWWGVRFLEALLFTVPARDAATFVGGAVIITAAATAAALLPASRVQRIDPHAALRSE